MIRSAETYYDDGAPYNGSNEMLLDDDGSGRDRVLLNQPIVRQQQLLREDDFQMTTTMEQQPTTPAPAVVVHPSKATKDEMVFMSTKQERHRRRDSSPGRFPEVLAKSLEAPPEKPSLRRARSSPMDGFEQQHELHHHHRPITPLSQRRIRSPSPGRYPEVDDDTVPKRPEFIGRHHPNFKPKKSILKKNKVTDVSTAAAAAPGTQATVSNDDEDAPQPTRGRAMERDQHHRHHLIPRRSRSRSNSLTPVREQHHHFEEEDEEEIPSRPQDYDVVGASDDDDDDANSSSGTHSSSDDHDDSSSSSTSSSSSNLIVEDQFNAPNEFQPPNEPPVQLPLLHEVLIHYQQQQEMMMQQQQEQHLHIDFHHQENHVVQPQEPHVTVDPEDDVANERERELQFQMLLNSISGDDDNEVVDNDDEHHNGNDYHRHHRNRHRRHSYDHDQRIMIDDEGEIRPRNLSGSWRTYRLEHRYDEDDDQLERERQLRFESVLEGIMSTPAESSTTSTTDVGGGSSEIQQPPPKQNRRSSNASASAGSFTSRSKSPKAMARRSSLSSSVRTSKTATSVRSGRSRLSSTASFCYEYSKQFVTSSVSCLRCIVPGSNASIARGGRRQARRPSGSISTRYASNSRREGEGRRVECLLPENWDGIDASCSSSRYSSPSPDIEATLRNRYEEIENMPDVLNVQNSGLQCAGSFNRQSSGDLMMMDATSSHSNSSKGHSVDMTGKVSPVERSSPASDDILGLEPAMDGQQQLHHDDVAEIVVVRHAISCPRDHGDYGIGNVYDIVDTSEGMKRILSNAKGMHSCRCRECKIKIEKAIGGSLSGSKRNLLPSLREKNHFYACRECQQQFICSTCWQQRGQIQKQTRRRRPQQEPHGSYYN